MHHAQVPYQPHPFQEMFHSILPHASVLKNAVFTCQVGGPVKHEEEYVRPVSRSQALHCHVPEHDILRCNEPPPLKPEVPENVTGCPCDGSGAVYGDVV